MKTIIAKLHEGRDLLGEEMHSVMRSIMSGNARAKDVESFLLALRAKGPTVQEITAAAQIMRQFVIRVETVQDPVMDTCGTGGDKSGTFNISTAVALVVAGSGVAVAKHGNRSVSSRCGSADVLEALGVNIDLDAEHLGRCLDKVGIAFLFAQKLHPAMKHVAPIRKKLGVETIFNILGPLTNPASATHQMMGVYDVKWIRPLADVLRNLGSKRAVVVHGLDGLDEITTTAVTQVSEFDGSRVIDYEIEPEHFGLRRVSIEDIKGGTPEENAAMVEDLLKGATGSRRDIVVLNAAYALYAAENVDSPEEGVEKVSRAIDGGSAARKLDELKRFTHDG